MRELALHFELALAYIAQFLKTRLEYKTDFLIGLATIIAFHGVALLFIDTLFVNQALSLNGWTKDHVFFIYGFSIFPLNLFFMFGSSLYMFASKHIVEGEFDRILLRPLNTLFQVLLERIDLDDAFGIVVGCVIVGYASEGLGVEWNTVRLLMLGMLTVCGLLIYMGVFVALAALSFWFPDRMGFMPVVFNMIAFGKYPVTIYNRLIQFILMWIIPFAFVAFFPATHFMGKPGFEHYVWLTPVVALAATAVGYSVWSLGVRHYESTGS